jgi:hypothetical protein
MPGWEIVTMTGFRISHPYLARDPKCPKDRHPTRDCGCKVFKTTAEATRYIASKEEEARSA